MRVKWPASKGGPRGEAATELGRLLIASDGVIPAGELVRALSRAVVHIPMPEAASEAHPRAAGDDDGDVPLFVIEDDSGQHALVYSSPRALVDAWRKRGRITAAAVPVPTLLARWPAGVDMVVDAGLPQAREIPIELLQQVAMDAAGVPTAAGLELSSNGYDVVIPDPEPVQVIGASRAAADELPSVVRMWRATTRDHEPLARDVLTIVVGFVPETEPDDVTAAMRHITAAIEAADPTPARLIATPGSDGNVNRDLIERIQDLDSPYWSRTVTS